LPAQPNALPSLRPGGHRAVADVLRIAHRGDGAEGYDPATMARIAALGTHLVEVDIRSTADDHVVVHHDPVVGTGSGSVAIGATSLRDLGAVRPAEAVLRAAADAGLGIYLDIKDVTGAALARLVGLLSSEDLLGRVILAAGEAATVARCADAAPSVPRAVLFREVDTDAVALARAARADFVHPCWEAESRPDKLLAGAWLDEVRRHGLGVICWHEERPDVLTGLLTLGVDGICTDDPALLADLATG
jgi:glycerophosphoryl diester phosphodiesterase